VPAVQGPGLRATPEGLRIRMAWDERQACAHRREDRFSAGHARSPSSPATPVYHVARFGPTGLRLLLVTRLLPKLRSRESRRPEAM